HNEWGRRRPQPGSEPLSENDTMGVDAQRLQAVLTAALQARDPLQQATILDRECALDIELRQTVEGLLKTARKPAATVDPEPAPLERAQTALASTTALDPSADLTSPSMSTTSLDQRTGAEGRKEEDEPFSLAFLQPSTRPGSLGRLGHNEILEVLGR